ncbi:hypothetical protein GTE6_4 [Gordonia phage GTE6]|uniref:Uncharacterized protein n=1 Tax=Gordonia phage GTE6 TaxID=1647474 RepID=A0A0K0MWF3_9CAUD|nr:hypothetical protein AU100_gp04 [Gordonia phage GTE6]AKI28646.1 hypothetical protein GTE6_4 [Gordonia phage GTE6]
MMRRDRAAEIRAHLAGVRTAQLLAKSIADGDHDTAARATARDAETRLAAAHAGILAIVEADQGRSA